MKADFWKNIAPGKLSGALKAVAETFSMWWNRDIQSKTIEIDEPETLEDIPIMTKEGPWPLQLLHEGTGDLYHRVYYVDIEHPRVDAVTLMDRIKKDLNSFSSTDWMQFEKTKGEPGRFEVGDEYQIYIRGPWNGPVRTIDITPTTFTFATKEGHLEAGEIKFSLEEHPSVENTLRFKIESWARSKDMIVEIAYTKLKMAKVMQSHAWAYFCKRVLEESGGEMLHDIEIKTFRIPYEEEGEKNE